MSETAEMPLNLARIGDRFARFSKIDLAPPDAEFIGVKDLQAMSKEQLEEFYSKLTGTSPKKFKSAEVVVKNIVHQVGKMPVADPVVKVEPPTDVAGFTDEQRANITESAKRSHRRAPDTFIILEPGKSAKEQDKFSKLAPQAKECLAIARELAAELGRTELGEAELSARLDREGARLNTRQKPWRILQYYRSKFVALDLLRVR